MATPPAAGSASSGSVPPGAGAAGPGAKGAGAASWRRRAGLGRAEPEPTWAIIAGGGTAGHVVPGLAVARALVARGHPKPSIHYVGARRGLEARMVPEAGFGVSLLPGRGIARRLSAENIGAALGLGQAVGLAMAIVRRRQPAVVVAVGGYAGVPCGLAAVANRVPLVVVEQNAVPGAANRLLGRYARACAVSFPGTPLPRAVVTGNPVRDEILAVDRSPEGRDAAREALGLPPGRRVVAVTGGSLGALRINRAVLGAVESWSARADLAVRHAVGARDWPLVQQAVPELPQGDLVYQPVEFEDRMGLLLAAADLIVCRAGGNTVAEVAVAGVPSVMVPLPNAPGDHQTANARALVEAGAAVLVPDAQLDGRRLVDEVDRLLADPQRLEEMARAAATAGRRDAAARVAALVEAHARTPAAARGPG